MKKHILITLVILFFVACGSGEEGSATSVTPTIVAGVTTDSSTSSVTTDVEVLTITDTSTPTQTISNLKLVLNNTGLTIKEEFNGYILQIIGSVTLDESQETSQSTIAVYGTINSSATASLLKINTNYIGSEISVAVFQDDVFLAQSETFSVSNDNAINFGDITIGEK